MKKSMRIRQRDCTDCGAACIASVCAYYGLNVPVAQARQYAGTDQRGTTIAGIINALGKLRLDAQGVKGCVESLSEIPLPAIARMKLASGRYHYVVVHDVTRKFVEVMDPISGNAERYQQEEFAVPWTGALILAEPGDEFESAKTKGHLCRFWELAKPQKNRLLLACLASVMVSVLGLSMAMYVQALVDGTLMESHMSTLHSISAAMVLVVLLQIFIGFIKDLLALRAGQAIDRSLVMGYYRHLLHLPQRFSDTMRVGEIMSRMTDAVRISTFISDVAISMIVNIMIIVCSVSAMFFINTRLAVLTCLILPLYAVIATVSDRINNICQRKAMESFAAFDSQVVQTLTGSGTIKRLSLENFAIEKTEEKFNELMKSIYTTSLKQLYINGSAGVLMKLMTVVVLWAGSYLVLRQLLTIGELMSFYALILYFGSPLLSVIGASAFVRQSVIAADRLFEVMDLELEESGTIRIEKHSLDKQDVVVFENVRFGYNYGCNIFEDLNLSIKNNSITGIMGPSGCGKSTLAALLQKLYLPQSGHIRVNDVDIAELDTVSLRSVVVSAPQETYLFTGSVIENITTLKGDTDLQQMMDIAERLGITKFINDLPEGFQTIVSEQANNFSGGQKQLISIARALCRMPRILILDEATSSLDEEAEKLVLAAMEWFRAKGNTVIIIAHKPSALQCCDTILMIEHGLIV